MLLSRLRGSAAAAAVCYVHTAAGGSAGPGSTAATDGSADLRHCSCPADLRPAPHHRSRPACSGVCSAPAPAGWASPWTADSDLWATAHPAGDSTAPTSPRVCSASRPGWCDGSIRPDGSAGSTFDVCPTSAGRHHSAASPAAADGSVYGTGGSGGSAAVTVHCSPAHTAPTDGVSAGCRRSTSKSARGPCAI